MITFKRIIVSGMTGILLSAMGYNVYHNGEFSGKNLFIVVLAVSIANLMQEKD